MSGLNSRNIRSQIWKRSLTKFMKVNNWGVIRTLISIYDETVYENIFVKSSQVSEWVYSAITQNKKQTNPTGIYLLKVNNRKTKSRCQICSKLTKKILERCQWRHSGIFIVNFEHLSHLDLVFLLLILNMLLLAGKHITKKFCS